jgi:streptogramin lyase
MKYKIKIIISVILLSGTLLSGCGNKLAPTTTGSATSTSTTTTPLSSSITTSSTTPEIARTQGELLPLAGTYMNSITSGPDGNLWFTELFTNKIGKISLKDGIITEYPINNQSQKYLK